MASEIRITAVVLDSGAGPPEGIGPVTPWPNAAVAPRNNELLLICCTCPWTICAEPSCRIQFGPMNRLGNQMPARG